jgi:hypothetical protein
LEAVAAEPALSDVRLYLADWGFLTDDDCQRGVEMHRVEVIGLERFTELLEA